MNRSTRNRGFVLAWGTRSRIRRSPGEKSSDCPKCGAANSVVSMVREVAPTVYFIRVGPFACERRYAHCVMCDARLPHPSSAGAEPAAVRSGPPPLPGGAPAELSATPARAVCPTCGEALRADGAFCSRCGQDVGKRIDWLNCIGGAAVAISAGLVVFAVIMRIHRAEAPVPPGAPVSGESQAVMPTPAPIAVAPPAALPQNAPASADTGSDIADDPPAYSRQPIALDPPPQVLEKTPMLGSSTDGAPYEKRNPIPEPIIGFRIGMIQWGKRSILNRFEPIYASDYLLPTADMAVAKPGYAVGGVIVDGEGQVTAIRIVFMRSTDNGLNPKDSYKTDWFGQPTDPDAYLLGGNGDCVVGIYGRKGMNFAALGLILLRQQHRAAPPATRPDEPQASLRE